MSTSVPANFPDSRLTRPVRFRSFRQSIPIILATSMVVAGCTTTIIPPDHPAHPVTVLVSDYGRHSSLLLPDSERGLEEYAFGDWNYFALRHKNLLTATAALIHSPQSTLGRRWLAIDANEPRASELIGAVRTESVIVDADRVIALRRDLEMEYALHLDSEVYNPEEQLHFVRCDEPYNLFHNCNTVTAQWLRKLGVKTRGLAIYSRFQVQAVETSGR